MNTAAARENWVGTVVDGKYPLLKWLGGSEWSAVFATRLPGKEQTAAAIKLISPEPGTAERQVGQWKAAGELAHPHLLRLLAAGQCEIGGAQQLYTVMEYAEEDLSQVLPARALTAGEAREMLPPLLDALAYLHERRMLHGRVKPSNIMAVGSELKLSTDSVHGLHEGRDEGRPHSAFDAPEVAKGGTRRASDVWSVGVTLVRCLSQRPQVRQNYDPIQHGVTQAIPEPFRRIARECLCQDPKKRCTIADIRSWLQPAAATVASKKAEPRRGLSLGRLALISGIVVLAVTFGLRWAMHGKPEAPGQHESQKTAPQPAPPQQTATASVPTQPAATAAHGSASASPQVAAPTQTSAPKPSPVAASAPAPAAPPVAAPAASSYSAPPAYSTPGEVVERALPDVAVSARNTITGKVRVSVRVEVNAAGELSDATLAAPGPSKYFARLALEASRKFKFKAAEADGHPVASAWMLRYSFGQDGTDVSPTELSGAQ